MNHEPFSIEIEADSENIENHNKTYAEQISRCLEFILSHLLWNLEIVNCQLSIARWFGSLSSTLIEFPNIKSGNTLKVS